MNASELRAQLARITNNFVDHPDDDEYNYSFSQPTNTKAEEVATKQTTNVDSPAFDMSRNGKSIRIHEEPGHRLHYGATIWRCVCNDFLFLCDYFDQRPTGYFEGKRVLEVGAGTGLAGLAIAALGANVMLTDTSMALPLIRHNLSLNESLTSNVNIMELEWYDAPKYIADFSPPVDFIIASDVVYVAYQERGVQGSQENFFKLMREKGFNTTEEFTKTEDGGEDGTLVLHVILLSKTNSN